MKEISIKPSTVKMLLPSLKTGGKACWTPGEVRDARIGCDGKAEESVPPAVIVSRMAKGGVGKTTVIANLGSALAMMGHKVLMVDGDPQASLTGMFGVNPMDEDENIVHVGDLMHAFFSRQPVDFTAAVKPIYVGGYLDLIPADITLVNADPWLNGVLNRELLFDRMLRGNQPFFGRYDAILIDTAPATSLLTNALMLAGRELLVVAMLNGSSMKALHVLESNITEVNAAFPDLHMGIHIVANGYHGSFADCKKVLNRLAATYGPLLDENVLPLSTSFRRQDGVMDGEPSGPVLEREPSSESAASVAALARSLAARYGILLGGHPADASGGGL